MNKKIFIASTVFLVFIFGLVSVLAAQKAKEGTVAGIIVYTATSTGAPLDKERYALSYEAVGANLSDSGEGSFHNMSSYNVGVIYFSKGSGG